MVAMDGHIPPRSEFPLRLSGWEAEQVASIVSKIDRIPFDKMPFGSQRIWVIVFFVYLVVTLAVSLFIDRNANGKLDRAALKAAIA